MRHCHSGSRAPFTQFEDQQILDYILNTDGHLHVKGALLWRQLSAVLSKEHGIKRTWQSLRERFIKRIIKKLDNYEIPPKSVAKLLQPFSPREPDHPKVKRRKNMHRYSDHDDKAILQYALNHTTDQIKGNCMWKVLEGIGTVEGRSWKSLKNRFMNHLVYEAKNLLNPEAAEDVKRLIRDFVFYDASENERVSSNRTEVLHGDIKEEHAEDSFSNSPSTSKEHAHCVSNEVATSCATESNSETDDSEPLVFLRKQRRLVKSDSEDQLSDTASPTLVACLPRRSKSESFISDASKSKTAVDNDSATSNVTSILKRVPVVLLERCDVDRGVVLRNTSKTSSSECHREGEFVTGESSPRGIGRQNPVYDQNLLGSLSMNDEDVENIKVESKEAQSRNVSGDDMILFLAEEDTHVDPITETLFGSGIVEVNGMMMCLGVPNFPVVHPVFY